MSFTQERQQTEIHRKSNANKKNSTGIPLQMKQQYEKLSGLSFDDVRVHYNSGKPAQFQALAYTQGNQVFIGPGQETHLGHELGHVVQQKQGHVRATQQIGNIAINNDTILEREAGHIGKAASKLDNMPTQFASRQVPIQRMAIRAQQPPKGQEAMFARLEDAAKRTNGVRTNVINAGVIPSSKAANEENIAFMGHGNPNKIGNLEPEAIAQNIANVITVNEADGKKDTEWNGKVFLMGCNTGRAYREDESKELEAENMSLADKVEKIYNNRFVKPISDVVGTYLQIQAPPIYASLFDEVKAEESLTTGTGESIKEMMEQQSGIQQPLNQNPKLVEMVRKFTAYGSLNRVYNTLTDVFCNTKEAKMFHPLDDSISSKTPKEIRDDVFEFMKNKMGDKVLEFRDLINTFVSIPEETKNIMTKYFDALQLIHNRLYEEMNTVLTNGKINNLSHAELRVLSKEQEQLNKTCSDFYKLLAQRTYVDFTNDESTYHTAKAKALAAPE